MWLLTMSLENTTAAALKVFLFKLCYSQMLNTYVFSNNNNFRFLVNIYKRYSTKVHHNFW